MIYSLRIETPNIVRPNSKGKLDVPTGALGEDGAPVVINTGVGQVVSITYDFQPGDLVKLVDYVNNLRKTFEHSLHVVHLHACDESIQLLQSESTGFFDTVPVIWHLNITDEDVAGKRLSLENAQRVAELASTPRPDGRPVSSYIDRLMLHDYSTSMYTVDAEELRKAVTKLLGMRTDSVGICGSPLSTGEDCCLTARRDREWAAQYVHSSYVVLPSSNHQSMERCGCLRDVTIRGTDIITPDAKPKAPKTTKAPKAPKQNKIKKPPTVKRSAKAVMHP